MMKTVGDIIDLIKRSAIVLEAEYVAGLLGARSVGSTTQLRLDEVPPETPISKIDHPNVRGGINCYMFAYDMGQKLGAIPLEEALKQGEVRVRKGSHGYELYMVGERWRAETDDVYVIVGPHQGHAVVYTWHPGEPLPPIEAGLTDKTAVKVEDDQENPQR